VEYVQALKARVAQGENLITVQTPLGEEFGGFEDDLDDSDSDDDPNGFQMQRHQIVNDLGSSGPRLRVTSGPNLVANNNNNSASGLSLQSLTNIGGGVNHVPQFHPLHNNNNNSVSGLRTSGDSNSRVDNYNNIVNNPSYDSVRTPLLSSDESPRPILVPSSLNLNSNSNNGNTSSSDFISVTVPTSLTNRVSHNNISSSAGAPVVVASKPPSEGMTSLQQQQPTMNHIGGSTSSVHSNEDSKTQGFLLHNNTSPQESTGSGTKVSNGGAPPQGGAASGDNGYITLRHSPISESKGASRTTQF